MNRLVPADRLARGDPRAGGDHRRRRAALGTCRQDRDPSPPGVENLDAATAFIAACAASEDVREGQRAFMTKRRPQFRGR